MFSILADAAVTDALPSYGGVFLKMLLTLAALIVAMIAAVWVFRRMSLGRKMMGGHSRSIQVLERKPLSPKTMLYLIDVGGKQSVIAESQLEVKPLMSWDVVAAVDEEEQD